MRGANEAALESGIIQHSSSDAESTEAVSSSSKVSVPGQVSSLVIPTELVNFTDVWCVIGYAVIYCIYSNSSYSYC